MGLDFHLLCPPKQFSSVHVARVFSWSVILIPVSDSLNEECSQYMMTSEPTRIALPVNPDTKN